MSSNPYDFSSGFVGAMEASAKREAVRDAKEAREERRLMMEQQGIVQPKAKEKGFFETVSSMAKNLFNGNASFAQSNAAPNPAEANTEQSTGIAPPAQPVVEVDQPKTNYADGSPGGIQVPTDEPPVDDRPPRQISDDEKIDALRGKSPYVALYKEDPKKAESLYDQVSDFKKLSSTLTAMAAYDFIDGKGSDGLRQSASYLRQLQKEGVFEAAVKASHGDMEGAKKAFLNYGDVRDANFQIVPREVMGDDTGIKGGKTKYKVFDVKFPDGSGYTLDAQKLALEALSAKEYLERGDKEFDKDYKRADLGLKATEIAQRGESNRIAAADRADRKDDANFNRGIQLGNATFESISRTEIAPLEAKFEKEVAPFKDIATTNPTMYEQKVAPIRQQYDAEIGRRKMAFEAARQRYLIGLQKGERIDPYTIYSNAYRMLGNQ